jgi:hypothetical protein
LNQRLRSDSDRFRLFLDQNLDPVRVAKIVLDRGFISELVYGPLQYGRSRLTASDAAPMALLVAARGGVLVHLTGRPESIVARLRACSAGETRMAVLPPPADAARVSCLLAEHLRWSAW